jgi:hypothetical protein
VIKKIAIALVFAVLVTVGVGLALPRAWSLERSIVIARPAAMIYPYLFDLRRWQEWSVWTRAMDPQVRHTYEGPQDGVGAKWLWLGPKMGRGQLEITAADPVSGIELAQALESNEVNARGALRFSVEPEGTRVTWRDEGTLPLGAGLFRGMVETRLGEHFEASLEKLRRTVEALPEPVPPAAVGLPDAG